MKTSFTPGPWTYHIFDDFDRFEIHPDNDEELDRGEIVIADLSYDTERPKEVREANARLIAQAPRLLEALEGIVWKLNHNHDLPDYKGPARIDRRDATIKQAIQAIAAAKGD